MSYSAYSVSFFIYSVIQYIIIIYNSLNFKSDYRYKFIRRSNNTYKALRHVSSIT